VLQALTQDAQGRRPQARETLAQAFARAPEPKHYARLLLDEGAAMLSLLRDAEHAGAGGGQVRRLLQLAAPSEDQAPDSEQPIGHAAESLSDRELQVLRLLSSELTGPEIARQLFVSHNTVRTHTKHIFTKLDVTNRRAAVRRARERGLI
jgi:LuxR family maltose regulon positive regulatory protein